MKTKLILTVAVLLSVAFIRQLHAQSSAFTYQGSLADNGAPANGVYDLSFTIYDDAAVGAQQGDAVTNVATEVVEGLFTVTLDFGTGVFDGSDRWLEIGVVTNGGGAFSSLSPRQAIAPTPYALRALAVTGNALEEGYPGVTSFSNPSNTFTGTFTGDGSLLTDVDAATLDGYGTDDFWQRSGNAGTTPGVDFIGTSDNQPLEMRVNGQRALRLEPAPDSPNVVGGAVSNSITPGTRGATISGGGLIPYPNRIEADYATIGGGTYHTVGGAWSTIAGGRDNRVYGEAAGILGGRGNLIESNSLGSMVSGGYYNRIHEGNSYAAIVGGIYNTIQTNADYSFIGGGTRNTNQSLARYSSVTGGHRNRIEEGATYATVGGGIRNSVGTYTTAVVVGGGENNRATAHHSTISGGLDNTNAGLGATIGGGNGNVAYGNDAVISGGLLNEVHPLANHGSIGGGRDNSIGTNSYETVVGGGRFNSIGTDSWFATISGGRNNRVMDHVPLGTIAGGEDNSIGDHSWRSSIGAGYLNRIDEQSQGGRIGGGFSNLIGTNADYATIGGGEDNTIETDAAHATIGGGDGNMIHSNAPYAHIGGGSHNAIGIGAQHAGILGGWFNEIGTESRQASIQGGYRNQIGGNSDKSSIGGGAWNRIDDTSQDSTIGGGYSNRMSGIVFGGVVAGGSYNQLNNSLYGTISGGNGNVVGSSYGTVAGGHQNFAAFYGFAAGRRAKANWKGSFVWGDSQDADVVATTTNQMVFRAQNGLRLTEDAGGAKTINIGDRYRDNALIAWGKVSTSGTLNADFGVSSVTHTNIGEYNIVLTGTAAGIHSLIPVAMPEIDTPPTSASTVRIISINQDSSNPNPNSFKVYINNGDYDLVDNDFVFMVTAR